MEITIANKNNISINGFTKDQLNAYNNIIKFINNPYNEKDYKRAIIGYAGTGKTYLVKALVKNCNLSYSMIGISAPSHKAARILKTSINLPNIKINTVASDLGFKPSYNGGNFDINNPPFINKGRTKLNEYKLYIVDESSMVCSSMLKVLEEECKKIQCKIIYIGDDKQLPPPEERYSYALKGVKSFNLNQIVRQESDNPVKPLLEILRYDIENKTFKFLEHIYKKKSDFDKTFSKGWQLCDEQLFNSLIERNFNNEELEKNVDYCKVIAYTNKKVGEYNKMIRNSIIKDADKSIITNNDLIISYTTIVNSFNTPIIENSEDYIIKDVVNYTHPKYKLKGFEIRFQAIHGGHITAPLFVLDSADRANIIKYYQLSNEMVNAAKTSATHLKSQLWKDYYSFRDSCLLINDIVDRTGKIIYAKNIDYGFALTAHKSQGSTFDTVFVDVRDIVYDKYGKPYQDCVDINKRLYVACSRCKNKLYLKL